VQAGADVQLGSRTWVGPLATYTVGNFLRDGEPGYHSWLMGGVRLQVPLAACFCIWHRAYSQGRVLPC
jgi:hypothetical protein